MPFTLLFALLLIVPSSFATRPLHPRTICNSGVYVLSARGTDEASNHSRLDAITQALTAAIPSSISEEVQYPASLDLVGSVTQGVLFLQQRMTDYAQQCPGRNVVLIGYSQGAVVTEIVLAGTNLANTNYPPISADIGRNVAALIQFGDPTQVPGQGIDALGVEGCGIAGGLTRKDIYKTNMDVYADRLLNYCDADDPICCGSGHDAAAHVAYFGQNTTSTVVEFVKKQIASRAGNGPSSANSTSPSSSTLPRSSTTPFASESASPSSTLVVSTGAGTTNEVQLRLRLVLTLGTCMMACSL